MNPDNILVLPGWQDSGPDHWQSRWERTHGYVRVQQHDWMRPLRGDWISRVENELLARDLAGSRRAVLVAHSLGCITVAAWASHSKNTQRVAGALLVAPPDCERDDVREALPGWAPIPMQKLPFPSVLFASSDDPFCKLERAQLFAAAWGSQLIEMGPRGHLNSDSGLGDWPEAHAHLVRLASAASPSTDN
jgi:uncharacterized protein